MKSTLLRWKAVLTNRTFLLVLSISCGMGWMIESTIRIFPILVVTNGYGALSGVMYQIIAISAFLIGLIANMHTRKLGFVGSVFVALIMMTVGIIVYPLATHGWMLVALAIWIGISSSLFLSAESPWIHTLAPKKRHSTDKEEAWMGLSMALSMLVGAAGAFVGYELIQLNSRHYIGVNLLVAGICGVCILIYVLRNGNTRPISQRKKSDRQWFSLKVFRQFYHRCGTVIVIGGIIFGISFFGEEKGVHGGLLIAILALGRVFAYLCDGLVKKYTYRQIAFLEWSLNTGVLIILYFFYGWILYPAILLQSWASGLGNYAANQSSLNLTQDAKGRATLELITFPSMTLGGILMGWVGAEWSFINGFALLLIPCTVFGILLLFTTNRNQ